MIRSTNDDIVYGPVAPDGRSIAYVSRVDNTNELFLYRIGAVTPHRLTRTAGTALSAIPREGADDACACVFSPDGRQLAFTWLVHGDPELRVVAVQGDSTPVPRRVLHDSTMTSIEPHAWSPDGKWIAATAGRAGDSSLVMLISPADGSAHVLYALQWDRVLRRGEMAFSADGKWLALSVRGENEVSADVIAIEVATSRVVGVVTQRSDDIFVGWAPDGRHLMFVSDRLGSRDLWSVAFERGTPGTQHALRSWPVGAQSRGPTADGSLAYEVRPRSLYALRIARVDFASGTLIGAAVDAEDAFPGSSERPVWSHDGRSLALCSSRIGHGGGMMMVIRAVASGRERAMDLPLAWVGGVAWAPNDHAIVVDGRDLHNHDGVFLLDVSTGEMAMLKDVAQLRAWSADSRRIYFDRAIGDNATEISIVERDLASNQERVVYTGGRGGPARLALAPDASTLYYRSPVPTSRPPHDLIARNLATGAERVLLRQQPLGPLDLSPDGRYLTTQINGALQVIPTDGSPPRTLGNLTLRVWAPDGRSFIASTGDTPGRLDGPAKYWWIPVDDRPRRQLDLGIDDRNADDFAVSADGALIFRVETLASSVATELWFADNVAGELTRSPSPADTQRIRVSVSSANPTRVQKGFAGYNVALMTTPISYRDSALAREAAALNAGWIRFPAGSRANAFDWRTGQMPPAWVKQFNGTAFLAPIERGAEMLEAKGGELLSDAANLAARTGARGLIVCVNVFTDSPQSAGELAAFARAQRISILSWQLGNEPAFYPKFFRDAADYAAKMRPYADAIRAADP
ncbi:MAG TPA: hypothetical protein VE967_14125, partial [Gemmatimonadaceae bacterium]|nr:hypothetical protein [Gemmatimonadaceae bacterium]